MSGKFGVVNKRSRGGVVVWWDGWMDVDVDVDGVQSQFPNPAGYVPHSKGKSIALSITVLFQSSAQ